MKTMMWHFRLEFILLYNIFSVHSHNHRGFSIWWQNYGSNRFTVRIIMIITIKIGISIWKADFSLRDILYHSYFLNLFFPNIVNCNWILKQYFLSLSFFRISGECVSMLHYYSAGIDVKWHYKVAECNQNPERKPSITRVYNKSMCPIARAQAIGKHRTLQT